jgi:hypothetical protein
VLVGGGGQLGLGGALNSCEWLKPSTSLSRPVNKPSCEQISSADQDGGGGVVSFKPSLTSEPISSADHDGGGGVVSSVISSAHHDGGGGVASIATHEGLSGHHVGGSGRPFSSLPATFSTEDSSADHVGGGGIISLSAELFNDVTTPMKLASNLGGALGVWGMSDIGTSVFISKPGGGLITGDTLLSPGNLLIVNPGGGGNSCGESDLGTSSVSSLENESSISGTSNCGDGHHHGAGGTSSFAAHVETESTAKVESGAYNAASKER